MSDVAESLDWRELAACQPEDPELFFPISGTGLGQLQTARAKAVCRGCPARQPCLDYALDTRQAHGIWGGLSETERQDLHAAHTRGQLGWATSWPAGLGR